MLKGLLKILAVLAVLIALVVWTCDFWCFWMVKGYLMKRGYGCTAERFDIGFWPPRLEIEDLVIRNPKDFPDLRGLRIAQFKIVVPWNTLLGRGHHIQEVSLNIPEMVVVRAPTGEWNWERLQPPREKRERPAPAPGGDRPVPAPRPHKDRTAKTSAFYGYNMDRLSVKLGVVEYRDYRVEAGEPPQVITADLKVDRTYDPVPNLPLVMAGLGMEIALKAGTQLKPVLKEMGRDH